MKEKQWLKDLRNTGIEEHHQRVRDSEPLVRTSAPRFKLQNNNRKANERAALEKKVTKGNLLMLERVANRYMQSSEIANKSPPKLAKGSEIKKQQVEIIKQRKKDIENHKMLMRIVTVKHEYSAKQWERQEKIRQRKLRDMSAFPQDIIVNNTQRSKISGDISIFGGGTLPRSRPSTARTRREAAWNSNTDLRLIDSNKLLKTKYDLPNPECLKKPKRPTTADALRKKVRSATYAASKRGEGGDGQVGYGRKVDRFKPGYSADPHDRDFDSEYRDLFATAREEWLQTQSSSRKKKNEFEVL